MSNIFKSNNRKGTTTAEKKAPNIQIKRSVKGSNYSFAKSGVVAAGGYKSKIAGVEVTKTKAGEDAVDILYDLINESGKNYHVRMRYPVESYYFEELCDALLEAGLEEGMDIKKAVGIEEKITIDYGNGERIGSISERSPIGKNAIKKTLAKAEADEGEEAETEDDDEFDDFLPDDDEEDDD